MHRKKMNDKKSRRMFSQTASRKHRRNSSPRFIMRGGGRL